MPTTDEILQKFNEVYPQVEGLISAQALLYKSGMDDLDRMYKEWNIPGADKANKP